MINIFSKCPVEHFVFFFFLKKFALQSFFVSVFEGVKGMSSIHRSVIRWLFRGVRKG